MNVLLSLKDKLPRVNAVLLILFFISFFAFVLTQAFFTSSQVSDENVFISGTLEVNITQDTVLSLESWVPGDIHTLSFTLKNSGSLPTFVKGYLEGAWGFGGLDPSMVEIVSVEVFRDNTWVSLVQNELMIGEEFFLTLNGNPDTFIALQPEDEVPVQISIRLREDTPDEYQNQIFTTSLHIAGKQVSESSSWPVVY